MNDESQFSKLNLMIDYELPRKQLVDEKNKTIGLGFR